MNLYPHQLEANRKVWKSYLDGAQSVLLQASTGAGKTVSAAHLAKMRDEHCGEITLAMAHRREIINQTEEKMRVAAGLLTSVIMSGHKTRYDARCHIASIDTLRNRELPRAQFVIFDEAHRIGGATYDRVFQHYRDQGAKILLLTATPMRNDGKGLKQYADAMVRMPGMQWLIDNGFLSPVIYRVGIVPNLKGVKIMAGEYNAHQVEEVMMGRKLVGDVIENYLAYGRYRRGMLFAAGVKHSIYLAEKLRDAGVKAVHIDADTDKETRDRAKAMMEDGTIDLISSAQVYIEGTDIPCIDCIVDAKDWKVLTPYLQAGGRGMRTFPGKENMLYLCHSGNLARHGRLEIERDWELTEGKEQMEKFEEARLRNDRVQIPCQKCGFILKGPICSMCGFGYVPQGEQKDFLPGMLVELTQGEFDAIGKQPKPKKVRPEDLPPEEKQRWLAELRGWALGHGKTESWVMANFMEKFKHWPAKKHGIGPKEPSPEVEMWLHSRRIRWAKSQRREQAEVRA